MTDVVKKLMKVNVRARSRERAHELFCELLGGELVNDRGANTIGDFEASVARVGDVLIDMIVPTDPEGQLAGVIERRGEGIDSLCFEVEDINVTREAFAQKGIDFARETSFGDMKMAFVHPRDACGVALEFIEAPGQS
jgi:methylmalonyl-CoA/ethylmalonyl-CoA epimerase